MKKKKMRVENNVNTWTLLKQHRLKLIYVQYTLPSIGSVVCMQLKSTEIDIVLGEWL